MIFVFCARDSKDRSFARKKPPEITTAANLGRLVILRYLKGSLDLLCQVSYSAPILYAK